VAEEEEVFHQADGADAPRAEVEEDLAVAAEEGTVVVAVVVAVAVVLTEAEVEAEVEAEADVMVAEEE